MITDKKIKKLAIDLRKNGESYGEIKKKIGVSKSTLSYWLKTLPLTPEQRKRLYTKQIQILSRGSRSQKERREKEVKEIVKISKNEIGSTLSRDTVKLFGAALYWSEGSKTTGFAITNSDPQLISFVIFWLREFFNISPKSLKAHLNIYPQQNDKKIKEFWSGVTKIPLDNFGKSFIKPLSSGYKKNKLYNGTIKIYVPRGTDMRYKVFGWVEKILQITNCKVKSVNNIWSKNKKDAEKPANLR